MQKENLVVLKTLPVGMTIAVTVGHTEFKPNQFYRCSILNDNDIVINGEPFTRKEMDTLFETVHERVIRDFKKLELIDANGKPVSKAQFVKRADIHTYGNGRRAYKIWFFRNSKELMYGFYPMQDNKTENAKECYMYFTQIVEGNVESLDNNDVQFGNCGIPIAYGKLRKE